ncbi:SLAM family member 5-like [Stegostoma tigrinum]|uniref:SLAM family member 5-like n=1 Tax=Stegostoma tigrinum TaxID=3053191 RepID=UPI00202B1F7A|nr:SLAM family member 5-like [Stegostoma tigrinum]
MASVRAATSTFLLLLVVVSKCSTRDIETIYGFLNDFVSVPLSKPTDVSEIAFKLNNRKIFEWEDGGITYFGAFSQNVNFTGESVLIQRLQKNDTGSYTLDFIFSNGTITKKEFFLKVLEPLTIPETSCNGNDSVVTLTCGISNDNADITIEWKYLDSPVVSSDNFVLTDENRSLMINNPRIFPEEYICIAKQPKNSSQSAPVLLLKCFETGNGRNYAYLILPIILCLVVAVIVFWLFRKKDSKTVTYRLSNKPLFQALTRAAAQPEMEGTNTRGEPKNSDEGADNPVDLNGATRVTSADTE